MGIYVGTSEPKSIYVGTTPVKEVYVGTTKVRPKENPLCFTAGTAYSSVTLSKNGSPASVSLEISRDGSTWSDYTIGSAITLTNMGDKVYMRNKSTSNTTFSTSSSDYYKFSMTGVINASGDVTYLVNKNGRTTIGDYCFFMLFYYCASLVTPPELPATGLGKDCYSYMFCNCTSLETAPSLPATTLAISCYSYMFASCTKLNQIPYLGATYLENYCYMAMFSGCSYIKVSQSQYSTYTKLCKAAASYHGTYATQYMFNSTGGEFRGTPGSGAVYTSNTVV